MAEARRGRLSSIDLLPDEAFPVVKAAIAALSERRRTQEDIRDELNTHLLGMGLDPVSKSAFSRYSLHLAVYGARIAKAREIAGVFAEKMEDVPKGDLGLLIGETMKTIIYDVVLSLSMEDEAASMDILKDTALTLQRLENARKSTISGMVTRKDMARQVDAAVTVAATESGASAETIDMIRRRVLGVIKTPEKADE